MAALRTGIGGDPTRITFEEEDVRDKSKKKFKPLSAVRRLFSKKRSASSHGAKSSGVVGVKARSTTALAGGLPDTDTDTDDGGFASHAGPARTLSEDSIFSPDPRHSREAGGGVSQALSQDSLLPQSQHFQSELLSALSTRGRSSTRDVTTASSSSRDHVGEHHVGGASRGHHALHHHVTREDDDPGLPRSPVPPDTTADAVKPPQRASWRRSGSDIISVDGSEGEEEDLFKAQWKAAVPSKKAHSESNLTEKNMEPLDLSSVAKTEVLKSTALRDRMSIKPKGRRSTKKYGSKRLEAAVPQSLPALNEEMSPTTKPPAASPQKTSKPIDIKTTRSNTGSGSFIKTSGSQANKRLPSPSPTSPTQSAPPAQPIPTASFSTSPKTQTSGPSPYTLVSAPNMRPGSYHTPSSQSSKTLAGGSTPGSSVVPVVGVSQMTSSVSVGAGFSLDSRSESKYNSRPSDTRPTSAVLSSPVEKKPPTPVMAKSLELSSSKPPVYIGSSAKSPSSEVKRPVFTRQGSGPMDNNFAIKDQSPTKTLPESKVFERKNSGSADNSFALRPAEGPTLKVSDPKSNILPSPKEDYKIRRQSRSKTLPGGDDQVSPKMSPSIQRAHSQRVTDTPPVLPPREPIVQPKDQSVLNASIPETKDLSQTQSSSVQKRFEVSKFSTSSTSEPSWLSIARKRREENDAQNKTSDQTSSQFVSTPLSKPSQNSTTSKSFSSSSSYLERKKENDFKEPVGFSNEKRVSQRENIEINLSELSSVGLDRKKNEGQDANKYTDKKSLSSGISHFRGGSVKTSPTKTFENKTSAFVNRGGSVKANTSSKLWSETSRPTSFVSSDSPIKSVGSTKASEAYHQPKSMSNSVSSTPKSTAVEQSSQYDMSSVTLRNKAVTNKPPVLSSKISPSFTPILESVDSRKSVPSSLLSARPPSGLHASSPAKKFDTKHASSNLKLNVDKSNAISPTSTSLSPSSNSYHPSSLTSSSKEISKPSAVININSGPVKTVPSDLASKWSSSSSSVAKSIEKPKVFNQEPSWKTGMNSRGGVVNIEIIENKQTKSSLPSIKKKDVSSSEQEKVAESANRNSGRPNRSSKVLDMVKNFQNLQVSS